MTQKESIKFDAESVTQAWDHAAEAYAHGQATGRDFYRYDFLGPAQVAVCGDVKGLRLLDVGCGVGYFAREMAQLGASVVGVDISPKMINQARQQEAVTPLGIEYMVGDAADLNALFPAGSFDLATSCLALQDMPRVAQAISQIRMVLRPNGRLVMSILHPCSNTPYRVWERDADGRKLWLCLDRYYDRGPMECSWPWAYDFTTLIAHATLEDWFEWILRSGFQVCALREPRPSEAALVSRPDLEDATKMPYFLIFDLLRGE